MNLQLSIVAANAKMRSADAAALLAFWSRTFSHLADACTLMARAPTPRARPCSAPPSTASPPSARSSRTASRSTRSGSHRAGARTASTPPRTSTSAASAPARSWRRTSGSAAPTACSWTSRCRTSAPRCSWRRPESSLQKLALAFGDSAFHLGLAELVSGWLLLLAGAQTEAALSGPFVEPAHPLREEAARLRNQTEEALASPRRCRAEELPDGRRLIHNFRRAVSGAPRRVLL